MGHAVDNAERLGSRAGAENRTEMGEAAGEGETYPRWEDPSARGRGCRLRGGGWRRGGGPRGMPELGFSPRGRAVPWSGEGGTCRGRRPQQGQNQAGLGVVEGT